MLVTWVNDWKKWPTYILSVKKKGDNWGIGVIKRKLYSRRVITWYTFWQHMTVCQHNLHQPPWTKNTQSDLYLRRYQSLGVRLRQTLCLPWRSRWCRSEYQTQWAQQGWSWGLESQVHSKLVCFVDIWLCQVGNAATQLSGNSVASSLTFKRNFMKGHLKRSVSFMQRWATFLWTLMHSLTELTLASAWCQWCP